jgi:hypothetical protein
MKRLNPQLKVTDASRQALREAIAMEKAGLKVSEKLLKSGEGRPEHIHSGDARNAYRLARLEYAAGAPVARVKSLLGRAVSAYQNYHRMVLDRLRHHPEQTEDCPDLWGEPGTYLITQQLLVLLGKTDLAFLQCPNEAIESPRIDYGPEFNHGLHAFRHALAGKREEALSELRKAHKAKGDSCWSQYCPPMPKKDPELFAGFTGIEHHPLGALLLRKPDKYLRTMAALCEVFRLWSANEIRKGKMNPESLMAGTAWSLEATAFSALGRIEGMPSVPENLAIAADLLGD